MIVAQLENSNFILLSNDSVLIASMIVDGEEKQQLTYEEAKGSSISWGRWVGDNQHGDFVIKTKVIRGFKQVLEYFRFAL